MPALMGIINVTPDSFSDGGQYDSAPEAIARGWRLIEEGADILDIGGESTRPGAAPVTPQQEMDRVLQVIEGLHGCGKLISIDTKNAATMRAALAAGAGMINDVSALTADPDSLTFVAASDVPVCLMHMQGDPATMQKAPSYEDAVAEICAYLAARIIACTDAGIIKDRIIVDPGIGFGKTLEHNLGLLNHIARFCDLGVPVLLGASRKSFIEGICPGTPPQDRLPGSLAAALWAAQNGVSILRVHDVAQTKQALAVHAAVTNV